MTRNGRYVFSREIPVDPAYDVVVAGGGPGGFAAAIVAARFGARVLLCEATGCLGGMATSGLVASFDTMADGEKMIVGGFMAELVERMYESGCMPPNTDTNRWRRDHHRGTPFHPDRLKYLLDTLAGDAGVEVRFFTTVIDADADSRTGQVQGVIAHNVEGCCYIPAKSFIDATGDATVAARCGAEYREAGRDTDHIMPSTLCSLHYGIEWEMFDHEAAIDKSELLRKAIDAGILSQPDLHLPGFWPVGDHIGYLNGGHIFNLNALRCRDLSSGMMLGRKIVYELVEFYRRYIPGCENLELVTTAALMGVRESRQIVGEYVLTLDDFIARRQFPDQIAVYNKSIDIHPYDTSEEEFLRLKNEIWSDLAVPDGEVYGIPYGTLVPYGWKNLWVAGRPISVDVKVHGSTRQMTSCVMFGEAAGTAAVQSIRTGQPADDLDTEELVSTLRERGGYLPQPVLCATMTRTP